MPHSQGPKSEAVPCMGAAASSPHMWSGDLCGSEFYPEAVACKTETLLRSGSRCSFVYVTVLTTGKQKRKEE